MLLLLYLPMLESELESSVSGRLTVGGFKYLILPSLLSGEYNFGSSGSSLAFGLGSMG